MLLSICSHDVGANSSYAKSAEVWDYLKTVAEKYNSYKYIRFGHKVVGAHWHEESAKWRLQVQKGDEDANIMEDEVDVFLNAGGILKYILQE